MKLKVNKMKKFLVLATIGIFAIATPAFAACGVKHAVKGDKKAIESENGKQINTEAKPNA